MINITFGRWFIVLGLIFFGYQVVVHGIECSIYYCPGEEEWTCQDFPEEDECVEERELKKEPTAYVRT